MAKMGHKCVEVQLYVHIFVFHEVTEGQKTLSKPEPHHNIKIVPLITMNL